jgi:uracil-DNA glycosylase
MEKCRACDLGVRRDATGGSLVFGEGVRRGIMFIGEGPGVVEEQTGRPFSGEAGMLLHKILEKLKFEDYYTANLVCCRSCEPVVDAATGMPVFRKKRGRPDEILMRDSTPIPKQIEACRPRLHDQIYNIDPILIVATGATAAEHVLGRPVTITRERGSFHECSIPGATLRPVLTDKKQIWGRKIHGTYQLPTEVNEVRYTVLLTIHPSFVRRKGSDMGRESPLRLFAADIRLAVKTYERYVSEVFGRELTSTSDVDLSDVRGEDGD